MSDNFFITGLPRSRTAWFSAFMTASGFPCGHELINNCETVEDYKEKVKDYRIATQRLPLSVIHTQKERL